MNTFKELAREMRRKFRERVSFIRWETGDRTGPAPHLGKVRAILGYAKAFRLRTFVETGTYQGDTIDAVRRRFDRLFSIEINPVLKQRAAERFSRNPSVRIVLGNSADMLPTIVEKLTAPALFWLDGHYSGGITGKGERETPIVEELRAIAESPIAGHVILIDDARLFDGTHDYPTRTEIESLAARVWPSHTFVVEADIIRIAPRHA